MGINEIIIWFMMIFMFIGAFDRILTQFGGSAHLLGKIGLGKVGKGIEGSGEQFDEGFLAMGALGLAMVGITALAPVIKDVLGPVIIPLYETVGANPAMFAGTILAIDMGGYPIAQSLSNGDTAAALYSGVILASMMGATVVFSIPVALGIINKKDTRFMALGMLAGMIAIPVGCLVGGIVAMFSGITVNGELVKFTFSMLLINLIPVIVVALLIVVGLKLIPEKMISGFQIFAKILVVIITIGLAAAVFHYLTGVAIIPGMDPIFNTGDGGMRAIEIIGSISCVLLGAYPMVLLLTRWFQKAFMKVGSSLKMNDMAAGGMLATLANNIPMFSMMSKMDNRGKVINCAFAVCASFALGDHLGFTAGVMSEMIFPMIVGKLAGGVFGIFVAIMMMPKNINDEVSVIAPEALDAEESAKPLEEVAVTTDKV